MPNFQDWAQNIQPLSVPTTATSTQYILLNADGFTSTVFTSANSDFTYSNGIPTGGTITSMSLVVNSDHTVLQSMTNLTTNLGVVGSLIDSIESLRSQIAWLNVVDSPGESGPAVFTPTDIIIQNTDGTFTEIIGSNFAIASQPTGTVTEIRHLASNGTTVLDDISGLNISLGIGVAALFNDNAGQQLYVSVGQGNETLQGFTPFVTNTDIVYTNLDSTPGNDTLIGEPLSNGNRPYANFANYDGEASAININLVANTVTTDHGTDTLIAIVGAQGSSFDDVMSGNNNTNGFYGADGNDYLSGLGGGDFLEGGRGADTLIGGAGSDVFVFGTDPVADAQANTPIFDQIVDFNQGNTGTFNSGEGDQINLTPILSALYLGGNGEGVSALIDVVMDASGTFAMLEIDPDGSAGGAGWVTLAHLTGVHFGDQISVILDGSGSLPPVTVSVVQPSLSTTSGNGSTTDQFWDVQHQFNWFHERNDYDPQHNLTLSIVDYDSGTSATVGYDPTNQFNWTDYRDDRNAQGQLTSSAVDYDDGTRAVIADDASNQFNWANYRTDYDTQGRVVSSNVVYDNGTTAVLAYDPANQNNWSDYRTDYDTQGRVVSSTVVYDDGARAVIGYDAQSQFNWSDFRTDYNSLGQVTGTIVVYDDGTRADVVYDAGDHFNWSYYRNDYDALGHFVGQTGVYDEGTLWHL